MRDFFTQSSTVRFLDTDGKVKSRLRLRHRYPGAGTGLAFASRYDLVQLLVTPVTSGGPSAAMSPQTFAMSDSNFDGVVDTFDLLQYVEESAEGVVAADLNVDDSIDSTDFDTFMESYIANGGT